MTVPEELLSLPVVFVMSHFELVGDAPVWLLVALLVISAVVRRLLLVAPGHATPEERQRLSKRPAARRRMHLAIALNLGLSMAICYVGGWGPLLAIVCAIAAIQHLNTFGSAAWRPALLWTVVFAGVGQIVVGLGWVYCYLPATLAQITGLMGIEVALIMTRALGRSAEQRERAEAQVRNREERFRALVQDSTDAVSIFDASGQLLYVSPAIEHLTGLSPEEFVEGDYAHRWVHPDDAAAAERTFIAAVADPGGEHRVELRLRHTGGELLWIEVTMRNLIASPAVGGLVVTYRDVTERRIIQERLVHDARHDPLTGLANRAAFLSGLEQCLADGAAGGRTAAVLFVDLDAFKQVNDTLGHRAGDRLIVAVAAMLRRSVLAADVVGRLGGDEFGIALTSVTAPDDAVTVAKRILTEMSASVLIDGREISARASIGIAVAEPGTTDADTLLHHADVAMYEAKRRHSHGFQLYIDGMPDPAADAAVLDDELRRAVGNDELRLHYQPIVALDSGDLLGFEALLRWQHPSRGLLAPLEFIPLAEQTGTIDELGAWVLENACRQVYQWQRLLPAGRRLKLSVNVSPRQLERPDLVAEVLAILRDTGYDPADLVLEITENTVINEEPATSQLTALRAAGIRIALDDFGTGYSSLRYLTQLPIDILKIDRCFVADLNGTGTASVVAETVVRLAQVLHLETIAEGIEDQAQLTELTQLGCQSGQGYHFARPLDPRTAGAMIADAATHWPSLGTAVPVLTG